MVILGINETHCATAAVLQDGKIVGCTSEERFTRVKNDAGYPRRAVDALLASLGITPREIKRGHDPFRISPQGCSSFAGARDTDLLCAA